MTRIRADDYDDKRNAILGHAAALFSRKGFEGSTMVEVAQACGTSKSHLYHYFSRKEDLLYEIVREHITAQATELEALVAQPLPAEERFVQFIQAFVERSAASRNEHLVLMHDIKFLPEHKRADVRRLEKLLVDLMASLLHEINPQLMPSSRPRAPYPMLLFGMIIWTFTWYEQSGAIAPRELAARIAQLFVHGFKGQHFEAPAPRSRPVRRRRSAAVP